MSEKGENKNKQEEECPVKQIEKEYAFELDKKLNWTRHYLLGFLMTIVFIIVFIVFSIIFISY